MLGVLGLKGANGEARGAVVDLDTGLRVVGEEEDEVGERKGLVWVLQMFVVGLEGVERVEGRGAVDGCRKVRQWGQGHEIFRLVLSEEGWWSRTCW